MAHGPSRVTVRYDDHVPSCSVDVLLADADVGLAARAADLLRREGYAVIAVASADDALRALADGCAPRLLLFDATLAAAGVFALLEALAPGAAIVALSGMAAWRLGHRAAVSVLKPIDAPGLLSVARLLCGPA